MKYSISAIFSFISRRGRRGFTLVEILIGVAIFALLLFGMNEFMSHGRRQAENAMQKDDNLREARLALQWMESDVRNSQEIKEFDENGDRVTMTLKHVKEIKTNIDPVATDPMVYDYVTYTYYFKPLNVNGVAVKANTLHRVQADAEPAQGAQAATPRPLLNSYADNQTGNAIGVIPSYEFPVDGAGTVKKESKFFAIDKNYYFNKMWDDAVTLDQKNEMIAKATYKGKLNGAEVGFTDVKSALAVWLQFVISDNNKNVYFFNQIVYMRSRL